MLGCVRTKYTDNECLELYTNKLFQLTSEETQRLAYSYRDILVIQENKHVLAYKAMLSILQIKKIMNRVSRFSAEPGCKDDCTHSLVPGRTPVVSVGLSWLVQEVDLIRQCYAHNRVPPTIDKL
jgi:hypothetical protein